MRHPVIEYREGPITSLLQLLESMYAGSRKTHAVLHVRPGKTFVREHYDDGKGHSNAFTSKDRPVAEEVFAQAKERGLISGALKPGYVSRDEFVLTDIGLHRYCRFKRIEREALGKLPPTKAMRACDIAIQLPGMAEEEIAIALEESVRAGRVDKEIVGGQALYYQKEFVTA